MSPYNYRVMYLLRRVLSCLHWVVCITICVSSSSLSLPFLLLCHTNVTVLSLFGVAAFIAHIHCHMRNKNRACPIVWRHATCSHIRSLRAHHVRYVSTSLLPSFVFFLSWFRNCRRGCRSGDTQCCWLGLVQGYRWIKRCMVRREKPQREIDEEGWKFVVKIAWSRYWFYRDENIGCWGWECLAKQWCNTLNFFFWEKFCLNESVSM